MTHENAAPRPKPPKAFTRHALALVILLASCAAARAQGTTSATDGSTPEGLKPGAPAGSYQLSGFDNVNFFNGNLNFHLPLLTIGGRGSASSAVSLKIERKWSVARTVSNPAVYFPESGGWQGLEVGYGPGVLVGRLAGASSLTCGGEVDVESLLRLTFIASDGTEFELRDTASNGDPGTTHYTNCLVGDTTQRGREFVTADGTSATFVSDAPLQDGYDGAPEQIYPSGYLMLRDGTRYRVESGLVRWLRDRNGNKVSYEYAGTQVTKITDPLGREVNVSYGWSPNPPYSDTITYKGFGGAARTISVRYDRMGTALRDGQTLKSVHDLFCPGVPSSTPCMNGGASTSGNFEPVVATSVELPDGRSYRFKYDSYGELARAELPTGGAFEYDWDGGLAPDSSGLYFVGTATTGTYQVYRRVVERRVYPDGGAGAGYASRMRLSKPEENGTNVGYAVAENYDGAGVRLTSERHYFYGSAKVKRDRKATDYEEWKTGREWKTEVYDLVNGAAVLARTTEQTWQQPAAGLHWPLAAAETSDAARPNEPQVTAVTTTLVETGQVSKQEFAYDAYVNRTDVWEYDFGIGAPGALLRRTHADYVTAAAYVNADVNPSLGAGLRGLVSRQWVSADAAGANKISLTTYAYDQFALSDCPGVTGHDAGYGTGFNVRGNATSVTSYTDAAGSTGAVTASTHYDVAGNAVSTTDARGNTSSVSYADSFSDGVSRNTYAFPTSAASAAPDPSGLFGSTTALTTSSVYDFSSGLTVSTTDANNKTASLSYADDAGNLDPLDRLMRIIRPDGGSTRYFYGRAGNAGRANDYVQTRTTLDAARFVDSYQFFDGLGRPSRSFADYTPGAGWRTTDTRYDALGRPSRVSDPYFTPNGAADPFGGAVTTSTYDALGRVTGVTTSDGAAVVTSYAGNTVTVTDQAGRRRRSVSDALGRLVRVDEPDAQTGVLDDAQGNPVQPTSYAYDALGNLRLVNQGGQLRFFMYDSLGRLVRAKNPEQAAGPAASNVTDPVTGNGQWSMAYGYDPNGNLTARVDARGVATTYGYDALNRNTTVRYSDSTKDIDRHYDGAANGRGRFWYFNWDPANNARFDTHLAVDEYDAAGRVVKYRQHFLTNGAASAPFTVTFAYNLAGSVTTETYPSGHSVSYSYDGAGRLGDFGGQPAFAGNLGDGAARAYSSEVLYDRLGGMRQERFGTDTPLYHKQFYNTRGHLAEVRVGFYPVTDPDPARATSWQRGAIINHYGEAGWGAGSGGPRDNGNLRAQDVFVPNVEGAGYDQSATVFSQSYGYDYLNRLKSAAESGGASWAQGYAYDRWGNRTINAAATSNAPAPQFTADAATNRLVAPAGYTAGYDAAGNLTYDNYTGEGVRTYDAESRMVSAQVNSAQSATYAYDADGRRVKRNDGGGEVWQVYGPGGELLAEYAAGASPFQPRKEYGYRGGELLVTAAAATAGWGAAPTFTDPQLAGKVVHSLYVVELRQAIDSLRGHKGLGDYPWASAVGHGDPVTAESFLELRRALDAALGEPAGGYTPGLAVRQPIRAVFLEELRKRVLDAWQGGSAGADIRWVVADQLGTPRMVADRTGSLAGVTRHDYLPFGEELSVGAGGRATTQGYSAVDNVRQKFTGYEHDGETNLDYAQARYYSGVQGRFTSVDPFDPILDKQGSINPRASEMKFITWISEPGRWNKYAYSLNNPLRYLDPDGKNPQEELEILRRALQRLDNFGGLTSRILNSGKITVYTEATRVALEQLLGKPVVFNSGGLNAAETKFASEVSAFEGRSFLGTAKGAPGIDGFLHDGESPTSNPLPIQLQENARGGFSRILADAEDHEYKANSSGRQHMALYIKSTDSNVTVSTVLESVLGWKDGGLSAMSKRGTFDKITIFARDGVVKIEGGKVSSIMR